MAFMAGHHTVLSGTTFLQLSPFSYWWALPKALVSLLGAILASQNQSNRTLEESLLVLRTLGVQTSTSSSTYLSTSTKRFIPTSQIQDVFIHEAFIGFEVRYYLAIVIEGEPEVVVVFPVRHPVIPSRLIGSWRWFKNLLPKRELVEIVWRGARACLFEPKT